MVHSFNYPVHLVFVEVVKSHIDPSNLATAMKICAVKTVPLSEVIHSGTPNLAIQRVMSADAHDDAFAVKRGIASGHFV